MRFSLDLAGSMLILSLFTTSSLARPSHGLLKHEHHHHARGDGKTSDLENYDGQNSSLSTSCGQCGTRSANTSCA